MNIIKKSTLVCAYQETCRSGHLNTKLSGETAGFTVIQDKQGIWYFKSKSACLDSPKSSEL
jgi:hypothetical protein